MSIIMKNINLLLIATCLGILCSCGGGNKIVSGSVGDGNSSSINASVIKNNSAISSGSIFIAAF